MFNQAGNIECKDARRLVEAGAQLIDVRSPQEYAQGALPGSVNLPLQALHAGDHQLCDKTPVILYCASGMRSSLAANVLLASGYRDVHDLGTLQRFVNCE